MLCNWRQGACPPYGPGLAYWSLREIVGAHAGVSAGDGDEVIEEKLRAAVAGAGAGDWLVTNLLALMGVPAPPTTRDENLAAWTRFIEGIAHVRPAVVVIEDLHWASGSTLEFLRHFAANASGVPMLLVGTARPELLEVHPGLLQQAPAVEYVDLKALDPGESSRLAVSLLAHGGRGELATQVAERCGGNPLFAEELARFLVDEDRPGPDASEREARLEAPTSILTLIAARLDALPAEQRDLLSDASVIGPVFWPGVVAAVSDSDTADLEISLIALEQREFLRRQAHSSVEGETELGFWHALVRDAAYDRLPRTARAVRHLRAAHWLEERTHESDDFAEIVAHHYATGLDLASAAGQDDLAAQNRPAAQLAFTRAGDRALRLDVVAAEHYFGLATEALEDDDPLRPELLLKRGEALRVVGRSLDAADLEREAALSFEAAGDARRHAYALSRLAYTLGWLDRDEGQRLARQAVDLLDGGASTEAISVLETWSTLRLWRGDLPAVLDATDRILHVSRQLARPPSARALSLHGYVRFILGDADGVGEMVEAISLAEESGSAGDISGLRDVYARCTCVMESPEVALTLTRRWTAEAEQRRDADSAVDFGVCEARYLLLCGRWDEARAVVARLAEAGRQREVPVTEAELCAINVVAHLGRGTPEEAVGDAARFQELKPKIVDVLPLGTIAVTTLASLSGTAQHATDLLEGLAATSFAEEPTDVLWWPLAVRTALSRDGARAGEQVADIALCWPSCPLRVRHTLTALLSERAGQADAAAHEYAAAAEAWRTGKSPYEEGWARLGLGRCLVLLGRKAEAAEALSQACALFAGIGSQLALAEAESVRQAAGLRVPASGEAKLR